jgi:hypothetical protein
MAAPFPPQVPLGEDQGEGSLISRSGPAALTLSGEGEGIRLEATLAPITSRRGFSRLLKKLYLPLDSRSDVFLTH